MITPVLRKLNLTAHIALSVAWIGAAAAFFVLAVAGLMNRDIASTRGAYLSMNLICLYSIIPLSLAALGTGLIQSLGTKWGLFRHYWVSAKFLLTTVSVAVLLLHQFSAVAKAVELVSGATVGALPRAQLDRLGFVLLRASGLGMVVLVVVTVLSVYKPWGLTPYGEWKQQERFQIGTGLRTTAGTSLSYRFRTWLAVGTAILLCGMIVFMHLSGHAFHHNH